MPERGGNAVEARYSCRSICGARESDPGTIQYETRDHPVHAARARLPKPTLAIMNFPLELRFKILAIASQIAVRDASGNLLCYVKQKAFKLKEAVTVFGDEEQTRPLYTIKADRDERRRRASRNAQHSDDAAARTAERMIG